MLKAISDNKIGILFFALAGAALVIILLASGCTPETSVKVDVPVRIAESVGAPPVVTLAEAPYIFEEWAGQVKLDGRQFSENIEQGKRVASFIRSLVTLGFEAAQAPLAGIPGGGIALSVLTALGGLFIRKPGTQGEIDNAYDLGRNEALATLRDAVKPTT